MDQLGRVLPHDHKLQCSSLKHLLTLLGVLGLATYCVKSHDFFSFYSSAKLHLYASHDCTLYMLLMALGVFDDKWPVYCADLAIEFWEEDKHRHLVKIKYNNQVSLTNCNVR